MSVGRYRERPPMGDLIRGLACLVVLASGGLRFGSEEHDAVVQRMKAAQRALFRGVVPESRVATTDDGSLRLRSLIRGPAPVRGDHVTPGGRSSLNT